LKKIGFTTTIPIEVLLAKNYLPVDLNNLFIVNQNHEKYIEIAEKDGFPKNICAWIKGIYGICIVEEINEIVGVVEGDCSNTKALIEVLQLKGIKVYPFSFPNSHKLKDVEIEIRRFMDSFSVILDEVENKRKELKYARKLAHRIDELTYIDNKATGFENHSYQISTSDFNGDIIKFEKSLEHAIKKISTRTSNKQKIRLGYIGVPPITGDIFDFVEKYGANFVYNEVQREFTFPRVTEDSDIFLQYYDYTYPYGINFRINEIKKQISLRKIDAIIHYTQVFCYRAIEDIVLRERLDIPILTIEGDKLKTLDARTTLRVEAFLDMINDLKEKKEE